MKMKIYINLGILALILLSPLSARAMNLRPDADIQSEAEQRVSVSFEYLGYPSAELISPIASTKIRFNVPFGWQLQPGGEIELHYDLVINGLDARAIVGESDLYGGSLLVSLNSVSIGSIPLSQIGYNTVRLKIPPEALISDQTDGSHLLSISLSAQFSCAADITSMVTIRNTSFFDLPYQVAAPELNLSKLPYPFYLYNSFVADSARVVLSESPDVLEIQAALNLMAGFGAMVGGDYDIQIATENQLTFEDLKNHHLIFVGMPGGFQFLSEVDFPLKVVNQQFENMLAGAEEDGVLEVAVSPWNISKAVMLVSGNSGAAVMKAAQAVSSGEIFVQDNPALSYISKIQPLAAATPPSAEDFTFENLGYSTRTLSGVGIFSVDYAFYASQQQAVSKDAYVDLVYYHSGLPYYGSFSFTVDLNREVITGTLFRKESEQVTTLRIPFPAGTLRFGENILRVTASLPSMQSCETAGIANPWLLISDQTKIHLPAVPFDETALLQKPADLSLHPDMFVTSSDLANIAFLLPQKSPSDWRIAGALAFLLGDAANLRFANLSAAYADNVPKEILSQRSLIVIGAPSTLPFLETINESLPAPFDFATQTASEAQMQVVYRIPPGVSVGYLELLASPFNSEEMILVVSGNNQTGVTLAGDALTVSALIRQLGGTFVITNGTQVVVGGMSSFSSVVGQLPGTVPVVTTPISAAEETPPLAQPSWLTPILIVSGLILFALLILLIWSLLRGNKPSAL